MDTTLSLLSIAQYNVLYIKVFLICTHHTFDHTHYGIVAMAPSRYLVLIKFSKIIILIFMVCTSPWITVSTKVLVITETKQKVQY